MEDGRSADDPLRILVVDPDETLRLHFQQYFLIRPDVEHRLASSPKEAGALLAEGFKPDAALLAYAPEAPEHTVGLCLRLTGSNPRCLLFAMCEDLTEGRPSVPAVNFKEFLEKPFSFQDLLERIQAGLVGSGDEDLRLTRFPAPVSGEIDRLASRVEEQPDDAGQRRLLAFTLYTASRFQEALLHYEQIEAAEAHTFYSLYYMGHTFARLHRFDEAIARWSIAMALAPTVTQAANVKKRIRRVQSLNGVVPA